MFFISFFKFGLLNAGCMFLEMRSILGEWYHLCLRRVNLAAFTIGTYPLFNFSRSLFSVLTTYTERQKDLKRAALYTWLNASRSVKADTQQQNSADADSVDANFMEDVFES